MPIASQSVRKPSRVYLRRGHPFAKDLVRAWPFFAGAGSVLREVSGRNEHGTFVNMDSANWSYGETGAHLTFNGSDERIDANSFSLPNGTCLAVINPNDTFTERRTIAAQDTGGINDSDWRFFIGDGTIVNEGELALLQQDGDTSDEVSGELVQTNEWNIVGCTWGVDTDGPELYQNGAQTTTDPDSSGADTRSVGMTNTNAPFNIGTFNDGNNSNFFDGEISFVAFWSRAMTHGEMRALTADYLLPFITKPR